MARLQHRRAAEAVHPPAGRMYDLRRLRLELWAGPASLELRGKVRFHFLARRQDVRELSFNLIDALGVDSIRYHGRRLPSFSQAGSLLRVRLPEPLAEGQRDSIEIHYHGTAGSSGFGSVAIDEVAGQPLFRTLSEPYGAQDWWPTKLLLSDKIDTTDVIVHTPAKWEVASNGLLVSNEAGDSLRRVHWRHTYPIPAYLVSVAIGDYTTDWFRRPLANGDSLLIANYALAADSAPFREGTEKLMPILRFFEERFGPYPYRREKYGHAQWGRGGGMEHATMSSMGNLGFDLAVHELAHQWFGDQVTCGSWQDIWLNEGFATWCQLLAHQEAARREGRDPRIPARRILRGWLSLLTAQKDGRTFVQDTTSVDRIFDRRLTYRKGALILNQLRYRLGRKAMFAGLRSYLSDSALAYGYARTADLRRHLEAACDCGLVRYFERWFFGEGFPRYQVRWRQEATGVLRYEIRQESSVEGDPPFAQQFPLVLKGEGRADTLQLSYEETDTMISGQTSPGFRVDSILFDPDFHIIRGAVSFLPLLEEGAPAVSVQPNPSRGPIRLRWQVPQNDPRRVDLFSVEGRQLRHWAFPRTNTRGHRLLQLGGQRPAGAYILRVELRDGSIHHRRLLRLGE